MKMGEKMLQFSITVNLLVASWKHAENVKQSRLSKGHTSFSNTLPASGIGCQ